MEKIVQTDIDNLADIIWWIKGYKARADEDANSCPFCLDHFESLRKVRVLLLGLDKKTQEKEETTHSQHIKFAISLIGKVKTIIMEGMELEKEPEILSSLNAAIAELQTLI